MNARRWLTGFVLLSASFVAAPLSAAELAPEQREKLVWIDQSLQKVVTLYRDKKTDDLKKLLGEIETAIDGVRAAGQGDVDPVLNPFRIRLAAAQKLAAYVPPAVAAIKPKPLPMAAPTPTATGGTPGAPAVVAIPTTPLPPGAISFVKEVAPMLVGKCGGCHVNRASGGLQFDTFAKLMAGTGGNSIVIKPGQGATSYLVEKIQNGEMPPGNPTAVSDADLKKLIQWINEGAKNDAVDQTASIATFVPGNPAAAPRPAAPPVVLAGAGEKIKFVRHVVPVLMKYCFDCHGAANRNDARGDYSFYSFTSFLRGGENGAAIKPGDPEGSLLIQAMRGTAKSTVEVGKNIQKMPAGRRKAPTQEEFDMIINWIKDGAKFDGDSDETGQSLEFLLRVDIAKLATHEELQAMRKEDSKKYWTRSNRDSSYEILESNDFTILSNVGPLRMQEYLAQAEEEKAKLMAELKLPTDKPLVKGRITLFIFDKKFEMSEFFTLIEKRQIPVGLTDHWFFNYIDCYGCLIAQPTLEETAPLISEVIAGSLIDSLGSKAPRWFSIGAARSLAAKIHGKSPTVKQWNDDFVAAGSAFLTVNAIIETANLEPKARAVAQVFVADLMKSPTWATLVAGVVKGSKFNDTFQSAFRSDPKALFTGWMKKFK